MNIIEAARKGGKITGSIVKNYGHEYWEFDGNHLMSSSNTFITVTNQLLLADDYEPYEPQIVPKEAGELWYHVSGNYGHTYFKPLGSGPGGQICYMDDVFRDKPVAELIDPVHGQNGWIRLHPEVPDPNIERVVIENVEWEKTSRGITDFISPVVNRVSLHNEFLDLVGKKGKLTFEWNKAKP